jgi:NAD+ synthetase
VSGGVDSAVVYRLLVHASKQQDSPIKKIWALIMPICTDGTSNQDETIRLGCNTILKEPTTDYKIIDLTHVQNAYLNAAKYKNEEFINTWNSGQLASIVRTPCLYYHAALLQSGGYKSVVVGTTNRDEGAYVGFFGKASDGMVDLQPIADIHKSEVWEIARLLDVPSEIVNRAPQGDVWGSVDYLLVLGSLRKCNRCWYCARRLDR